MEEKKLQTQAQKRCVRSVAQGFELHINMLMVSILLHFNLLCYCVAGSVFYLLPVIGYIHCYSFVLIP